jgi:hypothetical protein
MVFIYKETLQTNNVRIGTLFHCGKKIITYIVDGSNPILTGLFNGATLSGNRFNHNNRQFYWDTDGRWDGDFGFYKYNESYDGIVVWYNSSSKRVMILKREKIIGSVSFGKDVHDNPFINYSGITDEDIEVSTETLTWRLKMDRV